MTELLTAQNFILLGSMLAAGALAGFASGLFGIGGGFVIVPTLLAIFSFLEIDPEIATHLAIGTSLTTVICTTLRSSQAHAKKGLVDFDILKSWGPWVVLGVICSLMVASKVDGTQMRLILGVGILLISINFIFSKLLKSIRVAQEMPEGFVRTLLAMFLGSCSTLLGIGGGSIAVLIMTFFGRSIHQAIATAAALGTIVATPAAIGFCIMGLGAENLPMGSFGYINVLGFAAIVSTSTQTAPLGAKLSHSLDPVMMKRIFGGYLIFTAIMILKDFF